jgi:cellobiose phosphorylase
MGFVGWTGILQRPIWRRRTSFLPASALEEEAPLRAELLGLSQLANHAKLVALGHRIDPHAGPEHLRDRLRQNAQVIRESYSVAAAAAALGRTVPPAAEWLLDNNYLIEDQIELVREHLPAGYARELPRLAQGERRGLPRVYDAALELVSHTDGRVDLENLTQFVGAYQSIHALTLGELWAVPVMLRLALLENARRVAWRVAAKWRDRAAAGQWADRFQEVAQNRPRLLIAELAELVQQDPPLTRPFVMELAGRLQGHHTGMGLVQTWLDQQLAERGQTLEQIRQAESQEQAADQVSMGNSVTSLRTLSTGDWTPFIESQSATEAALRRDPLGTYPAMDFHSRDTYRHVVERLAKWSRRPEPEVAAEAVRLAAEDLRQPEGDRRRGHVGYYLVSAGLPELERALGLRLPWPRRLGRVLARHALATYAVAVALWSLLLLAWAAVLLLPAGLPRWGWLAAGLLLLPILVGTALALTHWLATIFIRPRHLPRLDFSKGIPDNARTVAVVPTMLTSPRSIDLLLEGLEVRYLSNRGPNLCLALLTDWADAPTQTLPTDQPLLDAAAAGIEQLNARYAPQGPSIFFLLHRGRQWNPSERVWMGFERKRGKLADCNEFLRTGAAARFTRIVGDAATLSGVRYVITLDTDTQLPPGTAWRMAGALAHPLNRPWVDPARGCVTVGYGVLQPRVAISLTAAARTWFARLFAGEVGIDPYTRQVSNVYHDLFGRAQFIGKGIYDASAFDAAVGRRFPANKVLSHDLIEGCYARCGFLNDVELIEEHPADYLADARRRHRWVRGDWQIAAWIGRRVPTRDGPRARNPLDGLARWMILDNLRRSLVPPALLALLLLAWARGGWAAAVISLGVVALWLLPQLLRALSALVIKPRRLPWPTYLRHVLITQGRPLAIELLLLVFLPCEAWLALDAIARTLWRQWISHRRLLQWQTAYEAEANGATGPGSYLRRMWMAPALAVLAGAALAYYRLGLPVAAPFLAVWMVAPLVAWVLGRPIAPAPTRLTADQHQFLGRLARRTWRYFDDLVAPAQNWLAPDNYQEQREPRVAARTSPTNIGMGLLSVLAAFDLGYVSAGSLLDRLRKTLATLDKLERYRGHFLNWYSTATVAGQVCPPLRPRYVSTVDSGNLCAAFITLRGGLLERIDGPVLSPRWRDGLGETAGILLEEANRAITDQPQRRTELEELTATLRQELSLLRDLSVLPAIEAGLRRLAAAAEHLAPKTEGLPEVRYWLDALRRQAEDLRADLTYLAPWLGSGLMEAYRLEMWPAGATAAEAAGVLLELAPVPTLQGLAGLEVRLAPRFAKLYAAAPAPAVAWLKQLEAAVAEASSRAGERVASLRDLAQRCEEFADVQWDFLWDQARKLLVIGFNLDAHRLDPNTYDLLASEARVASFLGVACNQLPQEHWFALGRLPAPGGGPPALMSWSGSMFEYLMPMLLLPSFPGTLLDQTCRAAVQRQVRYGRLRGVPWGMSESCFNQVDAQMNYQYRAFGVPDLGLKRGLADDLVVAPYAAVMALMVAPREACLNLEAMARDGFIGPYGPYEAVDYTAGRLAPDHTPAVVRCFMAHHGGMGLLALTHLLAGQPMQRRFLADPQCRAAQVLLQERVPLGQSVSRPQASGPPADQLPTDQAVPALPRRFRNPSAATPEVHLLSNGRYHVMVTSAGAGSSQWNQFALTRWREDVTRDASGLFFYLRDVEGGPVWSSTFQPLAHPVSDYEANFVRGRADFRCVYQQVETVTHLAVSPEDDLELRRITLNNLSDRARTLELTSYAELVLQEPGAEAAHPAFNGLFVQTEGRLDRSAILATRRARSSEEHPPWLAHLLILRGGTGPSPAPAAGAALSFETSRARFLGRGRSPGNPAALDRIAALSNSQGAVLDPIVALRQRVRLARGQSVTVDVILAAAESRAKIEALVERYQDQRLTDRVFETARVQSQVLLHELRATEADAELFESLAGSVIYANPRYRAVSSILARNHRGQNALWSYSVSGDLPIVMLRVGDAQGLGLVRQMLQAHAYWRHQGLRTDLVIWSEAVAGYRQGLLDQCLALVNATHGQLLNQPGGVFLRAADQVPEDDRVLFQAVARLALSDSGGSLREQAQRRVRMDVPMPAVQPMRRSRAAALPPPPPRPDLIYFNGLGGFTADGREYVITVNPGAPPAAAGPDQGQGTPPVTPMPWAQVLANPRFGCVLTESGLGYTWLENAHEFRLSPWYNDPVSDPAGEALYLRDEESGQAWSATPAPAPGAGAYTCRHGLGYSVYEHRQEGLASRLSVFVDVEAPVKFMLLTVRNHSPQPRRVSATGYVEWVLGDRRERQAMHVVTRLDPQTGALLAGNAFGHDFPGRVAFYQVSDPGRTYTGDRGEFLGRNGSAARPAALRRQRLSNRVGAGLDPCAALQAYLDIPPGQERQVVFLLGAAGSEHEAHALLQRFNSPDAAQRAQEAVWEFWKRLLGGAYVETPDPAVNFLVNYWLLYQTLSSRFWGRSGYYQSGGAYGFRDQLQDAMAFVHECPWLLRAHLLTCAARQFREGDVQHWWHPPAGRGTRTTCSDDFLWLPYATCRYVQTSADTGVLDEMVPFLNGRLLAAGEESCYDLPAVSDERASLYEHCVRALRRGMRLGTHGLPLIGGCDWNDGLNRVGREGKGESVWLAFFLLDALRQFAPLAEARGDSAFAQQCRSWAQDLHSHVEAEGWDGQWYRRAYFDDGTPLGSAANPECQLDILPQAWAVLSKSSDPARAATAMRAATDRLVDDSHLLMKLFDPPFDQAPWDPGYIKGYVPGVRENGGQYTHATVWAAMALAELRQPAEAWRIFACINPIAHTQTPQQVAAYQAEPYVVAADIYTAPGHEGRGGWTWYTGSAAWTYRLILEHLLGVRREGNSLVFAPVLPAQWQGFALHYRFRETMYHIRVEVAGPHTWEVRRVEVDGVEQPQPRVPLTDDHAEHQVRVSVG